MKMNILHVKSGNARCACVLFFLAGLLMVNPGCVKTEEALLSYNQVNLVANAGTYGAARLDSQLLNGWGIAISPSGVFWISSNHAGATTVYNGAGAQILPAVKVPYHNMPTGGSPTGVVFNSGTGFVLPILNKPARFIYAAEDGTISGWAGGGSTIAAVDRSFTGAVYKGLAIAADGRDTFIYAANFHAGTIEVFDKSFQLVTTKPFKDPTIPAGFAPFNIQAIGDKLFVTYAKQKTPEMMDDQSGPGNGYVNIFNTNGTLVRRFASNGALNSPWGIAQAPSLFGFIPNTLLVGNFGDGRINVYAPDGAFLGPLRRHGVPISIPGLWAIVFHPDEANLVDRLYFAAGPKEENDGLFGYVAPDNGSWKN